MKKTYKVINIEWDTDGDKEVLKTLPTETEVTLDFGKDAYVDDEDALDFIADELSDEFGFSVVSFDIV